MRCVHFVDWRPYALFTTCGTSMAAHMTATSTRASGALGAKQDVVVTTATTASAPSSRILLSIVDGSHATSSPFTKFSITIGTNPAVVMALKQDFWSMRGQMTYLCDTRDTIRRTDAPSQHPSRHWSSGTSWYIYIYKSSIESTLDKCYMQQNRC